MATGQFFDPASQPISIWIILEDAQHLSCKQMSNSTSGLKDAMAGTIAIFFFERFYTYALYFKGLILL